MLLVTGVLLGLAVLLSVPVGVLVAECMAACLSWLPHRPQPHALSAEVPLPRVAVLMPAHNEAIGIEAALSTILPQLGDRDRLLVVADNCDDNTAAIARHAGATVIERQDTRHRGKGYALDFGRRWLAADPPGVVVIADADCQFAAGAIAQIAQQAASQQRPVQAIYLMAPPASPSPGSMISAFAFLLKNQVRPSGLARLGLPCLLTGTGMAFPWQLLRHVPLASGNIVEDMQLGLDLAIAGSAPRLCPTAYVTGILPPHSHAAATQRTRWEHGHLHTLLTQVPRLLNAALKTSPRQGRIDLLAIALDLCIPPLSLLVMLWAGLLAIALYAGLLGAAWTVALLLGLQGGLMAIALLLTWAKFGRTTIGVRSLLSIPLYVLGKLPRYLRFITHRQTEWIRTERMKNEG